MHLDNDGKSYRVIKGKGMAIVVILFLMVSSSVAVGVSVSSTHQKILSSPLSMLTEQETVCEKNTSDCNRLVSNNSGDEYHPRMTTNGLGHTIVVYEQEFNQYSKKIAIVYSDDGQTWINKFLVDSKDIIDEVSSGVLQYPDIVYNPLNDLLYVTMIDPNAEMYNNEMGFIQGDIVNATDALWYAISSAGSLGYFSNACTCTHNYFLSLVTWDVAGLNQTLGLSWFEYPNFTFPYGMGGFYYDGNSFFQSAPAAQLEMDSNANQLFSVFETDCDSGTKISIKTNVMNELLITSGEQYHSMDKYGDPEVMPSEYLGFGTDPDVSGSGDKVCVVYIQDGDVICASSGTSALYDPLFNWHFSIVERDARDPAVYMDGNHVYCAYVKHGNLYLKVSEDGGVTWNEGEQKNDVDGTVVSEKGSVDICESGIVFIDKRNGTYDVFFSSYERVPTPCLVITDLFPMGMKIKNVGDVSACNVSWSIVIDGTFIIPRRAYSGVVLGFLEPGQEMTIGKREFLFGLGPIQITGTTWADNAGMVSAEIKGKLLFFFFFPE